MTTYQKDYYGFIYKWVDSTNDKNYVGSHKGSIEDKYEGSGTLFQRAFKKRPEAFSREILEYVHENNRKILLGVEQKYLDKIDWDNTYNLSPIAGGGNITGEKHPRGMLGKKHTEESKRQIGESHKGKKLSEDHKKNISETLKGYKHKEESIEIMRRKSTGKKHTEETKKKISDARKGKTFSEDHKQKISISLKAYNEKN